MEKDGALSSQVLENMVNNGQIKGLNGKVNTDQVQPGSMDLTLSEWGYCVKSVFLPSENETVEEAVKRYAVDKVDLSKPQILRTGLTYVFKLNEQLDLDKDVSACFSTKSSIGRLNLWVRSMANNYARFDRVPAGYKGPLYVMVTPKSWPICVQAGITLNQIRLYKGCQDFMTGLELGKIHSDDGLVFDSEGNKTNIRLVDDGVLLTADLNREIAAYEAKRSLDIIDLTAGEKSHEASDFFHAVKPNKDGELVLYEGFFYLVSTYEWFRVPQQYCSEMMAYDVASGEFRTHYAGFFDPGFGYGDGSLKGTPATLEIIPHEPVILRHRQPVCKMVFEKLISPPEKVYGTKGLGSHYQFQRGPGLSKYFKPIQ